jgi:hypothetical protein
MMSSFLTRVSATPRRLDFSFGLSLFFKGSRVSYRFDGLDVYIADSGQTPLVAEV